MIWLLGGVVLLPFLPALLSPLWPGAALAGHDLFFTFAPKFEFSHQCFPSLPLWHPQIYCGHPFAGNPQAMAFYPASLMLYLCGWSPPLASILTVLHLLLSALFFRSLCLRLGASGGGANVGALAWALGGQAMGRIFAGHLSWTFAMPWIPLLFLGLHGLVHRRSFADAGRAGLAGGFLLLCGAPQAAVYAGLAALLFFLATVWEKKTKKGTKTNIPPTPHILLLLSAALAPALLLGLAQALPTMAFLPQVTTDGRFPLAHAASGSMDPEFLITLLLPKHFGLETHQGGYSWEQSGYVGILGIILALRALIVRRDRQTIFFTLLFAGAILFALGDNLPLFKVLYQLPVLGAFRTPGRMMLVANFSLALLAAFGFPRASDPRETGKRLIPLLGLILLGALWFTLFPGLPPTENAILLTLTRLLGLALILLVGSLILRSKDPERPSFLAMASIIQGLDLILLLCIPALIPEPIGAPTPEAKAALTRAIATLPGGATERAGYRVEHEDMGFLGLFPELNQLGIHSTRGNYDPGVSRQYREWLLALTGLRNVSPQAIQYPLDLMAVRYRFAPTDEIDPRRERAEKIADQAYLIHRNNVPDRFRWVRRALAIENETDWPARLLTPGPDQPDPHKVVTLLAEKIPPAGPTGEGTVKLISFAPERIELEVQSRGSGFLVLSELFMPGWQARVNGEKAPIHRADLLFRALPLAGPGNWKVVLTYRPYGICSILCLLLVLAGSLLGMALLFMRRKRQSSLPETE